MSKNMDNTVMGLLVDDTFYIQYDGILYLDYAYSLFNNLSNVELLEGLEYINTSKITNMSNMFGNMSSLKELDVSSFDTSKVTYMTHMFEGMSSLTELNLSNFDTSQVTTMGSMFKGMKSLKKLDISSFDTSKVTYMAYMFEGMNSLAELDISSFDTNEVYSTTEMFSEMNSINKIYVSDKFNTSKVTISGNMFYNNTKLTGWNGTKYNSNNLDVSYAKIDRKSTAGYLSGKVSSDKYIVDNINSYIFIGNNKISDINSNEIKTTYGNGKIENNKYNIYSETELIKSYTIINVFNENYTINEQNNKISMGLNNDVSSVSFGTTNMIKTKVLNELNNEKTLGLIATGDKIQIYLEDLLVLEYTVVIKGDVTGDGQSTVADFSKAYQYFKKRIEMEDYYIDAADVGDKDLKITMAEVSKIYQFIKKRINSLD